MFHVIQYRIYFQFFLCQESCFHCFVPIMTKKSTFGSHEKMIMKTKIIITIVNEPKTLPIIVYLEKNTQIFNIQQNKLDI